MTKTARQMKDFAEKRVEDYLESSPIPKGRKFSEFGLSVTEMSEEARNIRTIMLGLAIAFEEAQDRAASTNLPKADTFSLIFASSRRLLKDLALEYWEVRIALDQELKRQDAERAAAWEAENPTPIRAGRKSL